MATVPMSAETSRLSFAKVAASAGKENVALNSIFKVSGSTSRDAIRESLVQQNLDAVIDTSNERNPTLEYPNISDKPLLPRSIENTAGGTPPCAHVESSENEAQLVDAVKALNVSPLMPSLVVNGSGDPTVKSKTETVDGFSEDLFQRTDFGSELGTKPPSLDGKSITSGTTYALDEKESLRPDDSASVKAAEDDDTFSGRGSIVAGSRIGSEAAARAYRAQFYEAPDRRNFQQIQEHRIQGAVTPQSSSSGQQATDDAKPKPLIGNTGVPEGFNLFYRQTPDEKLLEALESPKDRIFLLRLEQDVIEFVRASKEPFIDLPPCNSFCRMLTHKLADYYHMTHQVDAVAGAVRIFRTPFCRLPASLTSISNPPTSGNTPPATMKIMRRGGECGPSPSKALSEAGSDGKDKGLSAKEKLSREEREAAYNKARERIFGKEDKNGEATPETEDGNEMSRSSSISTKDRGSQNKRPKPAKQRRDDSESFDSRSQYTPFFPQPQGPTWISSAQYSPHPFNGTGQNFPSSMPPQYVAPPQQFSAAVMINTSSIQSFNPAQQYNPQNSQRFQQHHSAPISVYGSPVQSPPIASQQWSQQPVYQSSYQQSGTGPIARGPPSSIPYPFGQLPSTNNPADPKSQHPIPGSFNRHAFNPKTQSFIPGTVGIPQPMPHGSPHPPYNTFNPPQQQFGNGLGYNMARQGSNNSLSSYHASPLMGHRQMIHQGMQQSLPPQGMSPGLIQGMSQNLSQAINMPQNGQISTHLPNYGNPSTLPPKPPSGI